MCGITGKFVFKDTIVEKGLIKKMADTIIYRGPDDEGIYCAPHIGLGQRRLAIIDLNKSATAPLSNEDSTVWIVFNGEIYNYQILREKLITQGHVFKTHSDTEVIIHLYEQFGAECLQHLRGMFAFTIWDSNKKIIFAARDRLGKKPYFYKKSGTSFIFGSEIKAITADPSVSVSPDFSSIDLYLTYQYVPSPYTAFEGIQKIPPASYLICNTNGDLKIEKYWSLPDPSVKTKASEEEVQHEIKTKLREAVRLRMISDVPLGAFLSGGIDSGMIVAMMAQESSTPVKTFSIGFEEEEYNELPYARLVSNLYETDHHELIIKPSAIDILPKLVKHYNEPFADASALPTFYVSELAREHATVALSGDGGDENFGGYGRYIRFQKWSKLDLIPKQIRQIPNYVLHAIINSSFSDNKLLDISKGLRMISADTPDRYNLIMSLFKEEDKNLIYTSNFNNYLFKNKIINEGSNTFTKEMTNLEWMARDDLQHYLPDCLMTKTDVVSMANSLEIRCPLLDHEFVEYAATIPSKLKLNGNDGKLIFRNLANSFLPDEIIRKPKTGFASPIKKWFSSELSEMLKMTLLDDSATKRNLFQICGIKKMLEEQQNGKRDWSSRLWALMFLELWFREFID